MSLRMHFLLISLLHQVTGTWAIQAAQIFYVQTLGLLGLSHSHQNNILSNYSYVDEEFCMWE